MDKLVINGGRPLSGELAVSGMKNAAVAVVLATVLVEDKCVLENLPDISDINIALDILSAMGARVTGKTPRTLDPCPNRWKVEFLLPGKCEES